MPDESIGSIPAVTQLISLSMDIQNAGLATVIINFYGHVGGLDIRFFIGGWSSGRSYDRKIEFYVDKSKYDSSNIAALITSLSRVLIDRSFPESF